MEQQVDKSASCHGKATDFGFLGSLWFHMGEKRKKGEKKLSASVCLLLETHTRTHARTRARARARTHAHTHTHTCLL